MSGLHRKQGFSCGSEDGRSLLERLQSALSVIAETDHSKDGSVSNYRHTLESSYRLSKMRVISVDADAAVMTVPVTVSESLDEEFFRKLQRAMTMVTVPEFVLEVYVQGEKTTELRLLRTIRS